MGTASLADSNLCRLCGVDSEDAILIFDAEDEEPFCIKINRYLPIQVCDDGLHPRRVCPDCHRDVGAMQAFLERTLRGQRSIHALLQQSRVGLESGPLYPPGNTLQLELISDGVVLQKRRRGRPRKGEARPKEPRPVPSPVPPPPLERCQRPRGRLPARFHNTVVSGELDRALREPAGGTGAPPSEQPEPTVPLEQEDDLKSPCHIRVEVLPTPGETADPAEGDTEQQLPTDGTATEALPPSPVVVQPARGRGRRRKVRLQCEVCGKRFQQEGRLKFHRALHRGVRFECLNCNVRFKLDAELAFHQRETGHVGRGVVEGVDGEPLSDGSRLPCSQCHRTFSTQNTLQVHMAQRHNPDKSFGCDVCHKKFGHAGLLKLHEKYHTVRARSRYACGECGKVCNSKTSLTYHTETVHTAGDRCFVCNLCGKGFRHQLLLARHSVVHSTERKFKCPECAQAFKTKGHLSSHMVRHTGERRYSCHMCPQRFAYKTSLTMHLRWHTGEKPFECSVCQKRFSQQGTLTEHERIHTGEKPYPCTVCSHAFTTSSQLKSHMRLHGVGPQFRCEQCAKTFTSQSRWRTHRRLHGPRCTTCGKQFADKWSLHSHMRTHSGKGSEPPPQQCDLCPWTGEDADSLAQHRATHGAGDGPPLLTADGGPSSQGPEPDGGPQESQIIYVTYQNPSDPSSVQLVDGVAALDGGRTVQLSADSEVLLEDAAAGVVQLAANKGLVTPEGTRTLELTTEDGRHIQVTLQDVKGDLDPSELAAAVSSVSPDPAAGDGGGTVKTELAATDGPHQADTAELPNDDSAEVLITASDGRQFSLEVPAGADPVQFATEYIAGLSGLPDQTPVVLNDQTPVVLNDQTPVVQQE